MTPEEAKQLCTVDLFRAFLRVKMAYEDEVRQPHFSEFLWIFDRQIVPKGWVCRRCIFRLERQCTRGRQQGFQCLAYWWWHQEWLSTEKEALACIPLNDSYLQYLTHMQLLGVFYMQYLDLSTVTDFSKVGLRTRLMQIAYESPCNV